MPKILLYHLQGSPPSWAVRMLAHILGLELELKEVDFITKEYKSVAFRKMNPMGTIPLIKDGDFYIAESHTIMTYLLEKYGNEKQKALYPSDLRERALVDQAMYFDTGVAFIRVKNVALPAVYSGLKGIGPALADSIEEAYSIVEDYLSRHQYIALDRFTIADLSVGATVTSLDGLYTIDSQTYPLTVAYLAKLHKEPFFEQIAVPGSKFLAATIQASFERNSAL